MPGGETEWTISTLKELLETKLAMLGAKHDADVALLTAKMSAADEALKLKTAADDIHFTALNHENVRVAQAADKSLNIEVYGADQKALTEWKARIEGLLGDQAGRRAGVGMSFATVIQTVGLAGSVLTMLALIYTITSGTHALPVANPVTYIPTVNGQTLAAPPAQK